MNLSAEDVIDEIVAYPEAGAHGHRAAEPAAQETEQHSTALLLAVLLRIRGLLIL